MNFKVVNSRWSNPCTEGTELNWLARGFDYMSPWIDPRSPSQPLTPGIQQDQWRWSVSAAQTPDDQQIITDRMRRGNKKIPQCQPLASHDAFTWWSSAGCVTSNPEANLGFWCHQSVRSSVFPFHVWSSSLATLLTLTTSWASTVHKLGVEGLDFIGMWLYLRFLPLILLVRGYRPFKLLHLF